MFNLFAMEDKANTRSLHPELQKFFEKLECLWNNQPIQMINSHAMEQIWRKDFLSMLFNLFAMEDKAKAGSLYPESQSYWKNLRVSLRKQLLFLQNNLMIIVSTFYWKATQPMYSPYWAVDLEVVTNWYNPT